MRPSFFTFKQMIWDNCFPIFLNGFLLLLLLLNMFPPEKDSHATLIRDDYMSMYSTHIKCTLVRVPPNRYTAYAQYSSNRCV